MWVGFYADEAGGREGKEGGESGKLKCSAVVRFVAVLVPESACLMQEGATQGHDYLSQSRAMQPPRGYVNSSSANDACGCDCSVCCDLANV